MTILLSIAWASDSRPLDHQDYSMCSSNIRKQLIIQPIIYAYTQWDKFHISYQAFLTPSFLLGGGTKDNNSWITYEKPCYLHGC